MINQQFSEINIAPLTDVLLVLVVVLLLVAPVCNRAMLKVTPPPDRLYSPDLQFTRIVIDIKKDDAIEFDGQTLSPPDRANLIEHFNRILKREVPIYVVRPDRESRHKTTVKVMDAASAAHIESLSIIERP